MYKIERRGGPKIVLYEYTLSVRNGPSVSFGTNFPWNRSIYNCLQEQTLILLLVRIEANITACKNESKLYCF